VLVTSLRNIGAGEQMLKQKSIRERWPQFCIVAEGIKATRQRAGDVIHLLGGMDAQW
jgi:glycerol-3-phosphate dehydrogenase